MVFMERSRRGSRLSPTALANIKHWESGLRSLIAAIVLLAASGAGSETLNCNHIASDDDLSEFFCRPGRRRRPRVFRAQRSRSQRLPIGRAGMSKRRLFCSPEIRLFSTAASRTAALSASPPLIDGARETNGWLPAARVPPAASAPNWIGRWRRNTSAEIDITPKSGGKAEVSGSATWGSGAATHDGGISALIDTAPETQAFALDADGQILFEKAGTYDCAVRLKQLGPYLFARDNQSCGGANVSFTGLYRRR